MRPSNLTTLDFAEIRDSIKSYMRTRPEFTDYDFEGSTLSYLLDVLAYNTYYSSFNANMALNEVFLETATLRDNIVSIARMLNYLPRSAKAAWGCVSMAVQTDLLVTGNFPTHITLKKGQIATGSINNKGYTFSIIQDKIAEVDKITGIAQLGPFKVYEGNLLSYIYTVDTTIDQKFIIPNENVDIDTLQVYVKPNAQSTTVDRYSLVSNITTVDASSRSFFISEYEDRRYEVTFGDGIIGKALEDGNVIIFEYIKTNGVEGNNIKKMAFSGIVFDIENNEIDSGKVEFTLDGKTQLGDKPETIKSIKFNAPRFYSAQNRAVTVKDYENIIKTIYPNARYVMATGGESLNPPIYGKVYVSVKTKNNTKLNNLTKKQIIDDLRPYTMASIEIVVTDPEEIYVELNVLVVADLFQTVDGVSTGTQTTPDNVALPVGSNDLIKAKTIFAIKKFALFEDLGNFNKTLSTSKLQKEILQSDPAIVDVLLQVTVYKLLAYPEEENRGKPITWDLNFGIAFDCSCSTSPGDVVKTSGFYTAEYPDKLQFMEDDGLGKLRSYYIENNKKIYTNFFVGQYDCDTGIVRVGPISPVGEAEYIQLGIKPKNPANIAPGEVTGKLLARSNVIPGRATASPTLSSGSTVGQSVLQTDLLTVSTGSSDPYKKTIGGTKIVSSIVSDGYAASEIVSPTISASGSQASLGFITPNQPISINGAIVSSSSIVSTTIGGVTTSGAGAGGTPTAPGAPPAAAPITPSATPTAASTGGATGPGLTAPGAIVSSGAAPILSSLTTPGSAGAPGTVIIMGPPTVTIVPPGSPAIPAFTPGGVVAVPAATISTTPAPLIVPVADALGSLPATCFT